MLIRICEIFLAVVAGLFALWGLVFLGAALLPLLPPIVIVGIIIAVCQWRRWFR